MTDGVLTNMLIGPQISPAEAALASRASALRAAIADAALRAGRSDDCITLIAVSKGHGAECVRAAAALGITDVGESYLQEAAAKRAALKGLPLIWHFIGRLQANKSRAVAEQFDWVHGLDRPDIAARLSAQRPAALAPLNVCIQLNIAGEVGKGGVAPEALSALADRVLQLPRLRLRGLMCILPADLGAERNRRLFAGVCEQLRRLNQEGRALDVLSMGMSSDFVEAVAQGATHLRIGTALFGARQTGRAGNSGPEDAAPPPSASGLG